MPTDIASEIIAAYRAADYRILTDPVAFSIRVGAHSPQLGDLHFRYKVESSAVITASNPYGELRPQEENDLANEQLEFGVASQGLSYLPAVGEDPLGVPNYLMPYAVQVAAGLRAELAVFGGDYPTPDGTGVRDYIHVVDLAAGHVAALRALDEQRGVIALNLGTGRGYSVLELVHALARVSARPLPYRIVGRRPGDIAQCFADATLARTTLGWQATRGLEQMCADSWRWQRGNLTD